MHFYSPLRYPGGKARLSKYTQEIIDKNNLSKCVYIEPFAGGAGLGLNLLLNKYVSKILLNDVSKPIYSFWYSVINFNDEICNLVHETPINIQEWKKQKEIQRTHNEHDILKLGFSTLYLNRTNRSGILNGGVIGGIRQSGEWKIHARYNKKNTIKRLKLIHKYADRIEIHNLEAMKFTHDCARNLSQKSLFFIDPPYYNKGKYLYENYYRSEDHKKLFNLISTLKRHWIVTYDNNKKISNLYKDYRQKKYSVHHTAAWNRLGRELMIFSPELVIPRQRIT